jgi:putative membrane protein
VNAVVIMNDVMATTDRILNTPLPLAYAICISQLTWVYILILPFQLYSTLGLVAIPGTLCKLPDFIHPPKVPKILTRPSSLVAAYIILGFASIGSEIENPFGHDVNDLPLDAFCNALAADIDIIAASGGQKAESFVKSKENWIMHPLNRDSAEVNNPTHEVHVKRVLTLSVIF